MNKSKEIWQQIKTEVNSQLTLFEEKNVIDLNRVDVLLELLKEYKEN